MKDKYLHIESALKGKACKTLCFFLWVEIPLLADIYFLFSVQGSWTPDLYFANTESVLCNSKSNIDDRSSWHTQGEEIFQVWQI